MKTLDSQRWCGTCDAHGDHHTDRHPVDHNPNVDMWDCPCHECWTLEMDLVEPEERVSFNVWRRERTEG